MHSTAHALLARFIRAAFTVWLVVTIAFVILRLSGDPVRLLLPPTATPEHVEALRADLGLDRPIVVQYVSFLGQLARGDFGESLVYRQPAMQVVLDRFPATIELALVAFAFAAVLGLIIGSSAAAARGSVWDGTTMGVMGVLQSTPSFFLGILLILLFSIRLHWLPAAGRGSLEQLILPALTLGGLTVASLSLLNRSSILEVSRADYIRTARAKGLPERTVWWRHTLRNAALPIVTVFGILFAELLTGAVIVETVFAWPGIGRLAVDSISSRDYPVVQSTVLLFSAIFIATNLIVDIVYQLLDPRVTDG